MTTTAAAGRFATHTVQTVCLHGKVNCFGRTPHVEQRTCGAMIAFSSVQHDAQRAQVSRASQRQQVGRPLTINFGSVDDEAPSSVVDASHWFVGRCVLLDPKPLWPYDYDMHARGACFATAARSRKRCSVVGHTTTTCIHEAPAEKPGAWPQTCSCPPRILGVPANTPGSILT